MPLHRGTVASGFLGVVPSPPGGLTATTCANAQSVLSWSAPSTNGGSAVTDYVVEYSANSGGTWSTFTDGVTSSTGATVTGLSNGTSYVFRVAAVNTYGTGSYSGVSNSALVATVPGAPTISYVSPYGNGSAEVAWSAPASNGGASVASYTIQYSTSATFASSVTTVSPTVSSSPTVVAGLTNGTPYYFRVAATNCSGTGSYSAISSSVTTYTVPSAPAAPTYSSGQNSSTTDTFTWVAPASNGSPIDKYRWQVWRSNGTGWDTLNLTETTGLSASIVTAYSATRYAVRVEAHNAAGWSAIGAASPESIAWSLDAVSQSQACSVGPTACSCGSCDCGSNTGTQSGSGTESRTCYQWRRTTNVLQSSSNRDSGGVDPCSSSYSGCTATYGACTGCSGCTAETLMTVDGQYGNAYYYAFTDVNGANYMTRNNKPACGDCFEFGFYIYRCISGGVTSYRIVDRGCIQYTYGGPKTNCP